MNICYDTMDFRNYDDAVLDGGGSWSRSSVGGEAVGLSLVGESRVSGTSALDYPVDDLDSHSSVVGRKGKYVAAGGGDDVDGACAGEEDDVDVVCVPVHTGFTGGAVGDLESESCEDVRGQYLVGADDVPGRRPIPVSLSANCLMASGEVTSESYLHRFPPVPGGFKNLTRVDVPFAVQTLLSFGPKFSVPKVLTFAQYVAQHFNVHEQAQRNHLDVGVTLRGFLLSSCSKMLGSKYVELSPVEQRLYNMYLQTQSFLKDHPDLVLVEGDKSKCTVLMYAAEYSSKMVALIDGYISRGVYELLEDTARVSRLKKSWYKQFTMVKGELMNSWREANEGSKPFPGTLLGVLRKADQMEHALPYLYGVVKDHKEGAPCRPICSTKGCYSWALQKVIAHVLGHVTQGMLSDMNVRNVTEVAHYIRSAKVKPGHVLYKLDIVDMYTNMSRADILSVVGQFLKSPAYVDRGRLSSGLLMRCLELCLGSKTLFSFGGRVYRQISGLPQGAPDSGLLACILLDYALQIHHYAIFINCGVVFCHKYVDDFLFYLPDGKRSELLQLLQFHTGLPFSVEAVVPQVAQVPVVPAVVGGGVSSGMVLGEMSFLDIGIVMTGGAFYTRMYRKSMASSRTIHYLSNAPVKWKENTLSHRIFQVLNRSSNMFLLKDLLDVEVDYIENMYPILLLQTEMSRAIVEHVKICRAALGGDPVRVYLVSLGCLKERIRIVQGFRCPLANYRPGSGRNVLSGGSKRFRLDIDSFGSSSQEFARSVPYVSCETSEVVAEWHRVLSLGKLTHTNVDTLFQLLRMQKRSVDPSMSRSVVRGNIVDVVLLKCPSCNMCFLIRCEGGILTDGKKDSLRRSSSISVHEDKTGHCGILSQEPLPLHLNSLHEVPAYARVALMQAVYTALGYECKTDAELVIIPRIVQLGLLCYVEKYGAPHLESWVRSTIEKDGRRRVCDTPDNVV